MLTDNVTIYEKKSNTLTKNWVHSVNRLLLSSRGTMVKKTKRTRALVEERDKANRALQSTLVREVTAGRSRCGRAQGRPHVSTASALAAETC